MSKIQFRQLPPRLWRFAGIGVIVIALLSVGTVLATHSLSKPDLSNSIFSLLGQLNGTTDHMLQNTQTLHDQVQQVQGKLGELNTQEQILQQQTQTGQQLAQALTTQEQLTGQGVALMQQLLDRETQTEQITSRLSQQAGQLAQHVGENATMLQQLAGPLSTSAQESSVLNGQMDQLLAELHTSQDTFKLFGQLNKLLNVSPVDLPGTVSQITGSALPPDEKKSLLNLLPVQLPTLP